MAPTTGFDNTLCKMFDVANWVARLNGEDGPRGLPSHETLSMAPQGALEISSVTGYPPSLVIDHFSLRSMVVKPWQHDEGRRHSPQRPQCPNLYRRLKRRLGHSLRAGLYKRSVVEQEKRLQINFLELKAISLALKRFKDQCQNQCWLLQTTQK